MITGGFGNRLAVRLFASVLLCLVSSVAVSEPQTGGGTDALSSGLADLSSRTKKPEECKPAEPRDPTAWQVSAALGVNVTQGNIDANLITGGFRARREKDSNLWFFDFTGAQGEQEQESTQEFARGDAAYKRLLSERLYIGGGVTAITDQVAKIKYRAFLSPTVGYFLVKDAEILFSVEGGPSYVFEKQGEEDDNFLAPRLAERVEWQFSDTAKLFQGAEAFVAAEDSEDVLVNSEIGLEAALNSSLALVLTATNRFDNQPAPGRERNDLLFTSALKVSL